MFKKVLSVILVFCLCATLIPPALAEGAQDDSPPNVSPEALRVSDEFVEQYPNGLLEFATVNFDTREGADDFTVYVVRRGGTSGEVSVDVKMIEASAKYGDDFTVLVPTWYGEETLEKDVESPTMLESAVEGGKYSVIAPEDAHEDGTQNPGDTQDLDVAQPQDEVQPGDSAQSENGVQEPDDAQNQDGTQLEDDTQPQEDVQPEDGVQEPDGEQIGNAAPAEEDAQTEDASAPTYASSLHRLRDEALGVTSAAPYKVDPDTQIFEVNDPEQVRAGEALNYVMPGAVTTLTFADGENYKTFQVHICDDDKVESPEQFTLGLCNEIGGAVLGDSLSAGCSIEDNDVGSGSVIEFERDLYTVYPSDGQAELTLIRTGDTDTYADFELSTLSGTAKADREYRPIISDAIFLPGETEKTVKIPLLTESVDEELSFEVVVTRDGEERGGVSRATVNILPGEAGTMAAAGGVSLLTSAPLSSYNIVYFGSDFAFDYSTKNILIGIEDVPNAWQAYPPNGRVLVADGRNGLAGGASAHKCLDLRGIDTVTLDWSCSENCKAFVFINDKEKFSMNGWFDGWSNLKAGVEFERSQLVVMNLEIATQLPGVFGNLGIRSVTLRPQVFPVSIESADALTYNKWEGRTSVGTGSYNPGTLVPSSPTTCLGDTVTLTPRLSEEGRRRGVEYVGYAIRGPFGWVNFYDTSGKITLTPEFITTYIYGNGTTPYQESLVIKPLFKTWPVSVTLLPGDDPHGKLYWGDYVAGTSADTINWVHAGDEMIFALSPDTGYSSRGLQFDVYWNKDDLDAGRRARSEVDYPAHSIIVANAYNYISPLFDVNDKSVSIEWKPYEVGATEPKELNVTRGVLLHDHVANMPAAETAVLYNGVDDIPPHPDLNDYTNAAGVVDRVKYAQDMDEYRQKSDARYQKILQNYDTYRSRFSTRTLERLSIGEMVTLYAQPQEGYTVIWEIEDTSASVASGDLVKYIAHMGPSFTFEVTNSLRKIYYYFIRVNDAGSNILTGKVIQGKDTLRSQYFTAVDLQKPDSYAGVPGAVVSVAVADPALGSITVGGKTYSTTAITDKDGNFQIYVPFGVPNQLYSVKVTKGDQVYAQSVLVGKNNMIELPFMDNFKVWNFNITGVAGPSVSISNKPATISFVTTSSDGRVPVQAKLRSYTRSGSLWKTLDADTSDWRNWHIDNFNLQEIFKDGGRLTVELYDDRGIGYGEIESGFSFATAPTGGEVAMPGYSREDGVDLDFVGNVDPSTDLGTARSLIPQNTDSARTYQIAVNVGDTFKDIITENRENFDSKTVAEKLDYLAGYVATDQFTNSVGHEWNKQKIDWKNGAKVNPGWGTRSIDFNFEIGFYLQMTRKPTDEGNTYYFDYAVIYTFGQFSAQQDYNASIYGIPVYARFRGSVTAKILVLAQGGPDTTVTADKGYFPTRSNLTGGDIAGLVGIRVVLAIGGGVGTRGVLSAGLEGEVDFNIMFEPWNESKGTVTFALNVDIDALMLPIKFTVAKKTLQMYRTPNYVDHDEWMDVDVTAAAEELDGLSASEGVFTEGAPLERADGMSPWNGASNALLASGSEVEETPLQSGIYKHPEPQLLPLNDGKKILFFINDDLTRDDYDRTALYYSVYDGSAWSPAALVQDDGTMDYEPYAKRVGDRILVAWSSADTTFGDEKPDMADMLGSGEIYAQFFDLDGTPLGDAEQLTFDDGGIGDATPRIACDEESGDIMLLYLKTDYNTEGVEYNEPSDIGSFLHNSYGAVAYRMYVGGQWQTDYYEDETSYLNYEAEHGEGSLHGERFIDFDLAGVDPTKISEISLGSYDGEAQIIYTYDIDNDPGTKADTELFMKVYSFEQRIFTPPVRLTDDLTQDSNPQQAQYGDKDYLFWNDDGYITYLDIYGLLKYSLVRHDSDEGYYYELVQAEESYLKAFNERNDTAAESFTVTVGEDGGLYVVWDEQTGGVESDEPWGRQLFVSAYDPRYYQIEAGEDGNPVYAGGWGVPQRLTDDAFLYNNEQSVCVDENGIVTVASRVYERVTDESTEDIPSDTRESDFSSLVVRTFTPYSKLSVGATGVTVYPEYPRAGQPVTLTATAENAGLLPVDGATFRFEISDGADGWTALGDDVVLDYRIPSGEDILATTRFTMPEDFSPDAPAKLRITVWADGQENASHADYTVAPAENLTFSGLEGRLIDRDTVRITGALQNTGNADAENLPLRIVAFDSEGNSAPVADLAVGTLPVSESFTIDKTFNLDAAVELGGAAEFVLSAVRTSDDGETTACTGVVEAANQADTNISDILVNDGRPVTMKKDTMVRLGATVLPYAAANTHRLHYTSLTPDIAEVDPSSGMVTAKQTGTARILVEAEHIGNDVYRMGADGILYDAEGNQAEFDDETGALIGSGGDAESGEIVLTKTVSIAVTAQSDDSSDSDAGNSNVGKETDDGVILQVAEGGTVTGSDISSALKKLAEGSGDGDIQIVSTGSRISLDADALQALKGGETDVALSLSGVGIRLSGEVLASISQAGSEAEFSIQQTVGDDGRPVVEITIKSGGKEITDFGGERLLISVPYTLQPGEDPDSILINYIDGAGNVTPIAGSRYLDGMVSFMTDHLSKYAVARNAVSFSDAGGWASDYIAYLAARGIVSGTGDGKFTPDRPVTRAEFVKMLALLSGDELPTASESKFADIAGSAWYAPYVAWAAQKGYVNGVTADTFAPDARITREQMATIIARFAEAEGYDLGGSREAPVFTDSGKISGYAKASVEMLSKAGILSGRSGSVFAPQDSATRAESTKVFAVLLYKLLENMEG